MVFGSPCATETYCRDEMDPMALSGVSDFVAEYEIGEMATWRVAVLGKTLVFQHIYQEVPNRTPCVNNTLDCLWRPTFQSDVFLFVHIQGIMISITLGSPTA